jgi:hypothetical protein
LSISTTLFLGRYCDEFVNESKSKIFRFDTKESFVLETNIQIGPNSDIVEREIIFISNSEYLDIITKNIENIYTKFKDIDSFKGMDSFERQVKFNR